MPMRPSFTCPQHRAARVVSRLLVAAVHTGLRGVWSRQRTAPQPVTTFELKLAEEPSGPLALALRRNPVAAARRCPRDQANHGFLISIPSHNISVITHLFVLD